MFKIFRFNYELAYELTRRDSRTVIGLRGLTRIFFAACGKFIR